MLSSFLLTNRLYNEFKKSDGTLKNLLLIIIKYFIRRFLRVYVPFFILSTLIWFDPFFRAWPSFASWSSMVSLQSSGVNFLWTIAPEIKYYFFIPLFTLCMYAIGRYASYTIPILTLISICCDYYNWLDRKNEELKDLAMGYKLSSHFTIFFRGSLLGIIYSSDFGPQYSLFNTQLATKFKNTFAGFILLVLYLYSIKSGSLLFNPKIMNDMIYYNNFFGFLSFLMTTLMLYTNSNFFNDFFRAKFLMNFGEYSYGIYLLHQIVLFQVKKNFAGWKTDTEQFLFVLFWVYVSGWLFNKFVEKPLIKLAYKFCSFISSLEFFQKTSAIV